MKGSARGPARVLCLRMAPASHLMRWSITSRHRGSQGTNSQSDTWRSSRFHYQASGSHSRASCGSLSLARLQISHYLDASLYTVVDSRKPFRRHTFRYPPTAWDRFAEIGSAYCRDVVFLYG